MHSDVTVIILQHYSTDAVHMGQSKHRRSYEEAVYNR